MPAKHSINGSYLYYFIYKVLFLLLAQTSLSQEITQKTVWCQCLLIEVPGGESLGTGVMKKKYHVSWEEEVVAGWGLPILRLGSHRVSPPGRWGGLAGQKEKRDSPHATHRPGKFLERPLGQKWGEGWGCGKSGSPGLENTRGGKSGQFHAVLSQFPLRQTLANVAYVECDTRWYWGWSA